MLLTLAEARVSEIPLLQVLECPLADPENDELGWLHRGNAEEQDQPSVVDIVLRRGRPVALHEEGPERLPVGLENDPLGPSSRACLM